MKQIKFLKIIVGELETNCFLVWEDENKNCLIIDPGDDGEEISEEIQARGLKPGGVLATHGHFDHVMGALDLKLIYGIPFYCHSADMFLLKRQSSTARHFLGKNTVVPNFEKIDVDLKDIDRISLGRTSLKVIKTPGHTPGGVSFYIKEAGLLFCGDTIFEGSRGRTDLKYSSTKDIYKSIKNLMTLPDDTLILPGHGKDTNIGKERVVYQF